MTTDPTGGWAKAMEKAGEATTEIVKAGREAGQFAAAPLRQLVGMAEDALAVRRVMGQVRLAAKFQGFLRDRELEAVTRDIAPAFLLPLLERARVEEDDKLQDVWAMMLANAADADSDAEMRTAFVAMLGEMTHLDVKNLAKLDAASSDGRFQRGLPTGMLPELVEDDGKGSIATGALAISLDNLVRLRCIEPIPVHGGLSSARVWVTPLGKAFVTACTPPKPKVRQ